jgi:hypothetical protein
MSAESKGSGIKAGSLYRFHTASPALMWSFICTRLKRISYSCSHADDSFVGDEEGVGDGALLTDKLYPALVWMTAAL